MFGPRIPSHFYFHSQISIKWNGQMQAWQTSTWSMLFTNYSLVYIFHFWFQQCVYRFPLPFWSSNHVHVSWYPAAQSTLLVFLLRFQDWSPRKDFCTPDSKLLTLKYTVFNFFYLCSSSYFILSDVSLPVFTFGILYFSISNWTNRAAALLQKKLIGFDFENTLIPLSNLCRLYMRISWWQCEILKPHKWWELFFDCRSKFMETISFHDSFRYKCVVYPKYINEYRYEYIKNI